MKTINIYGKMIIIILTLTIVIGLCFGFYSIQQVGASKTSSYGRDGEVVAYAAAMASLGENAEKSKSEMLEKAQAFIDARDALIAECDTELAVNSEKICIAEKTYEELAAVSDKSYLTLEEYEIQMTDENKAIIAERNACLERTDNKIYELEQKNHIDDLPVLYYSLDELREVLRRVWWF